MATQFIFNNKIQQIPGAFSVVRSGIRNPALDLDFGNVLIIDAGGGNGNQYGGGRGITSNVDSLYDPFYTFDNSRDFQTHVHGGANYVMGEILFNPGGGAVNGSSSVTYVRAASTTAPVINMSFDAGANGGSIGITCNNEGYVGNGVEVDETRAVSVLSVSSSPATGDTLSVLFDGVVVGTYTAASGDDTNDAATGVAAAINEVGILSATSTTNTVSIAALRGKGASANTETLTIVNNGSIASTASAFSGGVDGSQLTRGYAGRLLAGTSDTSKYSLYFYKGTYKGKDSKISLDTGADIGGVSEVESVPELLAKSPEFSNLQEAIDWMETNQSFNDYFTLTSSDIVGTGALVAGDLTALVGNSLAAGGKEVYSVAELDNVLDSIDSQEYDFIILEDSGDLARSANNLRIFSWATTEAVNPPSLIVAGGTYSVDFSSTITNAEAYNSENVTLVHGGVLRSDTTAPKGFKRFNSLYHAYSILGRESGLEPQVPTTFKGVGIEGLVHKLKNSEIEQGLDSGVLMTNKSGRFFDIVKGVNTLQKNDFIVNEDGTTSSKQLKRIVRQLNKEIIINSKESLLKKPDGTNRNTLGEEDVAAWIEGFLSSKVAAIADDDNLILSYQDIAVTRNQDAYEITYAIVPNTEISFLFFTGFLIDPNN